jgi:hypothetical protein
MRFRRIAIRRALTGLVVLGVVFVGASSGSAASPTITFTLDCTPAIVNQSGEWGCTGTVQNVGTQASTHDVTVVQEYAGMTLVDSGFGAGECTVSPEAISCQIFNLAGGDSVQFTTILGVPPGATGTLSNHAYVSYDSGVSDGGGTGRAVIVCANTLGDARPCTTPESTSVISAEEAHDKAGAVVTYNGSDDILKTTGTLAQAGDVLTELQIPFRASFPNGFGATIVEATDPPEDSCPEEITCFGQTVVEDLAGDFATDDPVRGTFRLIAPKGKNEKNIVVYHDGVSAGSCAGTPLSATVDTCVESRSRNAKTKVVTIVVLSTDNGGWDFG